jgi:putative pyruvate formate lyase activating enzyme
MKCDLCPRLCSAERTITEPGLCGVSTGPGSFRIAKTMVHHWEEPYISGTRGSGTVFFSGCALGCLFCQNHTISHSVAINDPLSATKTNPQTSVSDLSVAELLDRMAELAAAGVHNLNMVTASHYAADLPELIAALRKRGIHLPIVWNTGSYERVETLQTLAQSIQVYLPDFKIWDSTLSNNLARASDYASVAATAILEMHRQQPVLEFDQDGLLQKGVAIRHLVLPAHYRDSLQIIDWIAANLPADIPLAIMSQYTPVPALRPQLANVPEMLRRVTTYEYNKVIEHAKAKGFTRLLGQRRESATTAYTPDF